MKGKVYAKSGKLYVVISIKKDDGKYSRKWLPTGLDEEKSNKRVAQANMRKAEAMTPKLISEFEDEQKRSKEEEVPKVSDQLFADFLEEWPDKIKDRLAFSTYITYSSLAKIIAEYFRKKGTMLSALNKKDIQDYYSDIQSKGKTLQECQHRHIVIRASLFSACKWGKISSNPASRNGPDKADEYEPEFYNEEKLKKLFDVIKGDRFELLYKMTAYYGLRRSEILGLKWDAIDFDKNSFIIQHSVIQTSLNGKSLVYKEKRTKTKSSKRSYPLMDEIKEGLLAQKELQQNNKLKYKKSYRVEDAEYVFVDEMGKIIRPETVSQHFKNYVLKRNGLPIIRFHDLRHSCASLLVAQGKDMKEIQEWLGHSTYKTTADIYSHLTYKSKIGIADTLSNVFGEKDDKESLADTDNTKDELGGVEDYKQAKAEMKRLGIKTMEEYFDYLEFKARRTQSNE